MTGFLATGSKKGREPAMTVIHADFRQREAAPALPPGPCVVHPLPLPARKATPVPRCAAKGRSGWVDLAKQDGFDDLLRSALTG